jgi:hypothetical protein
MTATPRRAIRERTESLARSLGEASSLGLGLVGGAFALFQTYELSDGPGGNAVKVCSAVLVAVAMAAAWRLRLYGVATGIVLSLFFWWVFFAPIAAIDLD